MIAHIPMNCPYCKKTFNVSEETIGDELSHMKMRKVMTVAHQMHVKDGPFYDRWVAAMEVKGPQKRCKTCLFHEHCPGDGKSIGITCKDAGRSGGCFACDYYIVLQEHS